MATDGPRTVTRDTAFVLWSEMVISTSHATKSCSFGDLKVDNIFTTSPNQSSTPFLQNSNILLIQVPQFTSQDVMLMLIRGFLGFWKIGRRRLF